MTDDPRLDRIEASLRRSFSPPDLSALLDRIDAAAASTPDRNLDELTARRRRRRLAMAAVAAAAAVVLLWLARTGEPPGPEEATQVASTSPRHAFGAELVRFVNQRPLPAPGSVSCTGPSPAPDSCLAPQPWLPATGRVQVLGECGAIGGPACGPSGLSSRSGLQLRVLPVGPRVLVCMDLLIDDPRPLLPADSRLYLFRRVLGGYVMYEVTPLPAPQALDLFVL